MNKYITQFAGFGRLLLRDVQKMESRDYGQLGPEDYRKLFARRAYQFACHIASSIGEGDAAMMEAGMMSVKSVVERLPDIQQWPEETR